MARSVLVPRTVCPPSCWRLHHANRLHVGGASACMARDPAASSHLHPHAHMMTTRPDQCRPRPATTEQAGAPGQLSPSGEIACAGSVTGALAPVLKALSGGDLSLGSLGFVRGFAQLLDFKTVFKRARLYSCWELNVGVGCDCNCGTGVASPTACIPSVVVLTCSACQATMFHTT